MPKISISRPARFGKALSTADRFSLWTWLMWTLRPVRRSVNCMDEVCTCHLTSCRVQSPTTSFAFEVLGLLMVDQDLQVIKISLAVITPWSLKNLADVRMTAFLFRHDGVLDPFAGDK